MESLDILVENLLSLISKENFYVDSDLASNVKNDFRIPTEYIMLRLGIVDLTVFIAVVERVPNCQFEDGKFFVKVRFPHETVILRDVPARTTVDDVKNLIDPDLHHDIKLLYPNANNTFYIKFNTEESVLKTFEKFNNGCSINGQPVKARLKNENPTLPSVPYVIECAYGYKYGESIFTSNKKLQNQKHQNNIQAINIIKKGNDVDAGVKIDLVEYDDDAVMRIIKSMSDLSIPTHLDGDHSIALNDSPNPSLARLQRSDSIDMALSHLKPLNPLFLEKNETRELFDAVPQQYIDENVNYNYTFYPSEIPRSR